MEDKEQRSPFKPPNDEEVFVTRETEKAKKKEAKESLKHQKIWDKNTSTSRAPLRRVKDSDIPPADDYKDADGKDLKRPPAFSFTPNQSGLIQEAMQITRKRVQFPKESRELNMQEFIDQKKEMFHAELAYTNVQQEIAQLENKKGERQSALEKSRKELNDDQVALATFIALDEQEKKRKEGDLKKANKNRNDKEESLKSDDSQIQAIISEIDKHKDALTELEANRLFLLDLTPEDFKDNRQVRLDKNRKDAFKNWMVLYDKDYSQDDIIFGEDEEIHGDIKLSDIDESLLLKKDTGNSKLGSSKKEYKPKRGAEVDRSNCTEAWLEKRFEQLMSLDLIELPEYYYMDKIFFEETDALDQQFAALEEKNLFFIHRIQEYEQYIEDAQYKIDKTYDVISNKVSVLEGNKDNLVFKINDAQINLEQYKKHSIGSKIMDQNSILTKSVKTKDKKQQQSINCDEMLNSIKKKLVEIRRQDNNKNPIQLLEVSFQT